MRTLLRETASMLDASTRYVELARDAMSDAAQQDHRAGQLLGSALGGVERIVDIVADRGALTGPRSAVAWLSQAFGPQPVHHAIDAAAEHLAPFASIRDVRIDTIIEADVMSSGPMAVYPIIVAVLRNAIEASAEHSVVDIDAHVQQPNPADVDHDSDEPTAPPHDTLVIEVVDHSDDFDPHAREHAFDPGFTTKADHAGVGLSLARDLARSARGDVVLERERARRRTVCRITLPVRSTGAVSERWIG